MEFFDKAFVELTFSQETKSIFDTFTKSIVPEDMFYSSPVTPHIKGNMTKVLHTTIFFGLRPSLVQNSYLKEILHKAEIKQIKLGSLAFIDGYQGLYKVLVIEIDDSDQKLVLLNKNISEFALGINRGPAKREFRPHLTLAYVKNEYAIPNELPKLPESVEIDDVRITLVSEFNKQINDSAETI